jgi:GMP reductase
MKYLSYQDILLVANYSQLDTREHADTSVNFCGCKFSLPVVPANMQDVINPNIAKILSESGYFYVMHRFNNSTYNFVEMANKENWKLISISTGVNEDSMKELWDITINKLRIDFITIDVAHGHHKKVIDRIQWIKKNHPNTKIIAGNVMTYKACQDLKNAGADAVKVGIGQGSICTTRFQTGFSMPMFSCIEKCAECDIPLIADGGVQYIGDIAKALVAGATMVMSGKLFAPCIDSPAQIVNGHKEYRGSTSFAAKKHNKHIEGRTLDLEADITIVERLQEIKEAMQSSISYGGGKNLDCFRKVRWIEGK